MLPDGSYDAVVVDADVTDGVLHLELVVVAGDRKGEVVAVQAPVGQAGDGLDLLGLPATLAVTGGEPSVNLEP